MTADKRILIIAGPNGAGKTTFAMEFLPKEADCPIFVNADLIAAGLNPFRPELAIFRAGRIMLNKIHEHVRRGNSSAFETTLSGRGYARWIPYWPENGYRILLIFLRLPTAETAIALVEQRVREGGHRVSERVIRRRFDAGSRNLASVHGDLVDAGAVYDNLHRTPTPLAEWHGKPYSKRGTRMETPLDAEFAAAEIALCRAAERAQRRAEDSFRRGELQRVM